MSKLAKTMNKRTIRRTICLAIVAFALILFLYPERIIPAHIHRFAWERRPICPAWTGLDEENVKDNQTNRAKIGKLSMAYGNVPGEYAAAIGTHLSHAERHNYQQFVLQRAMADQVWSKTTFIISHILAELIKPEEERLEWLMWFDADTVILNQAIPLEPFLPPASEPTFDNIYFVMSRDVWGLNTGIFFVRVHPVSARMLSNAYSLQHWRPEIPLGPCVDQDTFEVVLHEPENRPHVVFAPLTWFNTPYDHLWPGVLLGHAYHWFGGSKSEQMTEWLGRATTDKKNSEIPYDGTLYPAETAEFWRWILDCRRLLKLAGELKDKNDAHFAFYNQTHARLDDMLLHSDEYFKMSTTLKEIKDGLSNPPASAPAPTQA